MTTKTILIDYRLAVFFVAAQVLHQCGGLPDALLRDRFCTEGALRPEENNLKRRGELLSEALRRGKAARYLRGGPASGWELTTDGEQWHQTMLRSADPFCNSAYLCPGWRARFWKLRGGKPTQSGSARV